MGLVRFALQNPHAVMVAALLFLVMGAVSMLQIPVDILPAFKQLPPETQALLAKSGVGRDINRHYYTPEDVEQALQRPVVQSLFELIRFRNQHPAFNGTFSLPETEDSQIALRWDNGDDWALLEVDLASGRYQISNNHWG